MTTTPAPETPQPTPKPGPAPLITIEAGKRGGRPCIRGLRIAVGDVLEWLSVGMTPADIVAGHQELTLDDVRACLAFAADRERRTIGVA